MLSNHAVDYSTLKDDELENKISSLDNEIKELTNQRKRVVETILNRNADTLNDLLAQKSEPYGVVHINNLEITFPKKTSYDQAKLAKIAEEIAAAGEKVSDYIKIEYDISETKFKAWPEPIRAQFVPARTVKHCSPSIKIKESKE